MSGERFLLKEQNYKRVLADKKKAGIPTVEKAEPAVNLFVLDALEETARALGRHGVGWDPRSNLKLSQLDGPDAEIASFLANVPLEDPNLKKRLVKASKGRSPSGQDIGWTAAVIAAKAQTVKENAVLSRGQEKRLNGFVDKAKRKVGDLVLGGGRFKQVMAPVTAVAFLFAACNSGASPTIVPATEAAGPTVTEVAPVETETSFPSPIVVTPTKETSPTPTESPRVSEDQLETMSDEEKLAAAPESVDGYTKSNVSTVRGNLVIYRDEQGRAERVYDLTTGEGMTLKEGGIIEFDLVEKAVWYTPEEGEKLELLAFATAKEAFEYIVLEDGALRDGRSRYTFDDVTDEEKMLFGKIAAVGSRFTKSRSVAKDVKNYTNPDEVPFWLVYYGVGDETTILVYRNEDRIMRVVAVYDQNVDELYQQLSNRSTSDAVVPPQPES